MRFNQITATRLELKQPFFPSMEKEKVDERPDGRTAQIIEPNLRQYEPISHLVPGLPFRAGPSFRVGRQHSPFITELCFPYH